MKVVFGSDGSSGIFPVIAEEIAVSMLKSAIPTFTCMDNYILLFFQLEDNSTINRMNIEVR